VRPDLARERGEKRNAAARRGTRCMADGRNGINVAWVPDDDSQKE
jgi:hypothetical protein